MQQVLRGEVTYAASSKGCEQQVTYAASPKG